MLKFIRKVIAFLKSPLGKKVVKTAGELAQEGLERVQKQSPKK